MLNSIDEYLASQEEAFAQCEEFLPRMEKIKEADKIGRKILDFIDNNIKNVDMEALDSIDVAKIVDELSLNINEELDGDILSDIYKEIDDTFKQGGKVSLQDYLNQGTVVLADMLNELKGTVDYSIAYSEKQLKQEEKKAFERFQLVLSMQNLKEISFCFNMSPAGNSFLGKCDSYLSSIGEITPYAGSIEDKIGELNNSVLLVATMSELGCDIIDRTELNYFFSDKIKDVISDFSKYHEDTNIRSMFDSLKETVNNYKSNEVIASLADKIEKIDEKIFENINQKSKDSNLSI